MYSELDQFLDVFFLICTAAFEIIANWFLLWRVTVCDPFSLPFYFDPKTFINMHFSLNQTRSPFCVCGFPTRVSFSRSVTRPKRQPPPRRRSPLPPERWYRSPAAPQANYSLHRPRGLLFLYTAFSFSLFFFKFSCVLIFPQVHFRRTLVQPSSAFFSAASSKSFDFIQSIVIGLNTNPLFLVKIMRDSLFLSAHLRWAPFAQHRFFLPP